MGNVALWIGAGVVVVILIVLLLVLRLRNRRKTDLTSLVLLLREPRSYDAQAVRRAATKAFGVRIGSSTDEENFVVQHTPETMPVKINGLPLGFICVPRPYMDPKPPESALADMDVRLRKALLDHNAWISCDLMAEVPEAMRPEVYRHIARLLAEFVDDNCTGVFCPETDELMFYHPKLKEELRCENPLAALELKDVPVTQMSYDDPKLRATIDEAQRRWPEFADAFVKRRPGQTFGVKRKFTDGDETEYMWVVVTMIDGSQITGKLDNAPMKIKNVKSGDVIVLDRKDVLDWMYEEGQEMRGGFSLKVLSGA